MPGDVHAVDVWLGHAPDEAALDAFPSARHDADGEAHPTRFDADHGQTAHDPDYPERSTAIAPAAPRAPLAPQSFSASCAEAAARAATADPTLCAVPAAVLVWNRQVAAPRNVPGEDVALAYAGRFACGASAPPFAS